jgi:hypothetical protein
LPKNDPDFFDESESVSYWWLELDQMGVAHRETGFALAGHPIRIAPIARNRGVFIGEDVSPAHLAEALPQASFEEAWRRALETLSIQ